ncbi:hypothetical protein FB451DRAFT_1374007 [Mycena latifolia]|nr:hypothetical protein FB451DRAFT_1374007 [Mycena latifolia]
MAAHLGVGIPRVDDEEGSTMDRIGLNKNQIILPVKLEASPCQTASAPPEWRASNEGALGAEEDGTESSLGGRQRRPGGAKYRDTPRAFHPPLRGSRRGTAGWGARNGGAQQGRPRRSWSAVVVVLFGGSSLDLEGERGRGAARKDDEGRKGGAWGWGEQRRRCVRRRWERSTYQPTMGNFPFWEWVSPEGAPTSFNFPGLGLADIPVIQPETYLLLAVLELHYRCEISDRSPDLPPNEKLPYLHMFSPHTCPKPR